MIVHLQNRVEASFIMEYYKCKEGQDRIRETNSLDNLTHTSEPRTYICLGIHQFYVMLVSSTNKFSFLDCFTFSTIPLVSLRVISRYSIRFSIAPGGHNFRFLVYGGPWFARHIENRIGKGVNSCKPLGFILPIHTLDFHSHIDITLVPFACALAFTSLAVSRCFRGFIRRERKYIC